MSAVEWSVQALRTFPDTLSALVDTIPAPALDWRPPSWDGIPSEELTVRQQLCHLRDIEADGYVVRFTRILKETDPLLESIDTYALVEARSYDDTNIRDAVASFATARRQTMRLLDEATSADLARRGRFEGYGEVTVASLIHYLCSHDQQHLAGIQWLLGQFDAER
jgi:DinB superfamily